MRQRSLQVTARRGKQGWYIAEGLDAIGKMTGFSAGASIFGDLDSLFAPEDLVRLRAFLDGTDAGGSFSLSCAFGEYLPVYLQALQRGEEEILLAVCCSGGCGERLRRIKDRMSIFERSTVGGLCGFLADKGLTVLWYNQAYAEITGFTRDQFRGELQREAGRLLFHEDMPLLRQKIARCVGHPGRAVSLELRLIRRDRELRTLKAVIGYAGERRGGFPVIHGMAVDITAEKYEEELQNSAQRHRLPLGNRRSYIWEYDIPARRIRSAPVLEFLLGVKGDIEDAPESLIAQGCVQEDSAEALRGCFAVIHEGGEKAECVAKIRDAAGNYFPIRFRLSAIPVEGGPPVRASLLTQNVEELCGIELRSHEQEEWWAALTYGQTFTAQLDLTADTVLEANTEVYPFYDSGAPCTIGELIRQNAGDCIHPDDRAAYLRHFSKAGLMESFERGVPELIFEYRASRHGEPHRWRQSTMHMIHDPATRNICAYVYVKDITGKKSEEEELRRHAERDALTGLYNRMAAQKKCDGLLAEKKTLSTLLMLDLDDLKSINDTYGHNGGDQALVRVAGHLRELFGRWEGAILSRLGGDEFIVFLPDCPSAEEIQYLAQQVCRVGDSPLPCRLTCSVGAAAAPYDGDSFLSLYKCADAALYRAKRRGKNRVAFYDKSFGHTRTEKNPVSRDWLLEECSELVYVADLYNYDLLYMNHGIKQLYSLEGDGYKGQKCYRVLQGREAPCDFCTNQRISRDAFYTWEHDNSYLGHHYLIRDRIVDWYGQPARIEFATDVTELEQRNQDLKKQLLGDQAIIDCLRILNGTDTDFCGAVRLCLNRMGDFYQADGVFLIRRDQRTGLHALCGEWRRNGAGDVPFTEQEWQHYAQRLETCMQSGKRYRMDSRAQLSQSDPGLCRAFARRGIERQYAVPVVIAKQPAGCIGLDGPPVSSEDLNVLETVGAILFEEIARRRLEERLAYLSYHDTLTRLKNRNSFQEYLKALDTRRLRSLGVIVCCFSDIKEVNHCFGRSIGDQIIKRLAGFLRENFPKAKLFRADGNEFLVFEENIAREVFQHQARMMADDSHAQLGAYGISAGCAWTDREIDADSLIRQARGLL